MLVPVIPQPTPLPASRPTEVRLQPWSWADIENADYAKLASNLRQVECPEATIQGILYARITRQYYQLMLGNPMSKYWEPPEERKKRNQYLANLRRQKEKLLESLGLHSGKSQSPPVSAPGPFSPEKMQQIAQITQQYPKKILPMEPTPEEYQEAFDNRRARLQYLAQYLTPDELTQYRLTEDSNLSVVTKLLRVINATPAEIKNCAFAFDFSPASVSNGSFAPEAAQALQAGLGDQRYAELLAAFAPANVQFSEFVMQTDVTPEEITQLQQLRQQNLDSAAMLNAVNQLLGPQLAQRYANLVPNH